MKPFNIYLTGVGGQGIGLLSEVILRAADHAGKYVEGVDTHGLAQRGGVVISQIRIGEGVRSPLIRSGQANLVVALERHEALRGMNGYLCDQGVLVYYDAIWQPLDVRLGKAPQVKETLISDECRKRNIREFRVFKPDLEDTRMQNIVLLSHIEKHALIPGINAGNYIEAMKDLMDGAMLDRNLEIFEEERKKG
jgi:indolepyruvate ferredoxin oxidoreductase beta subunit